MPRALHVLPDIDSVSSHNEEYAVRLLLQISQQDHSALDTLYKIWAPTLLGIAFRMLGSRQEAEEAMQDTFVKLWHRAADYDPAKSKAFVWSFTILRSVCIDHLRYHRRQKRDSSKNISWDERDAPEPQIHSSILSNDTITTVRQALEQLPPEERRCLELAVLFEYTHSEISDELKTPLGTVKNRLRRAMEKLQSMLKNHEL
jgi:RNA polymerase sigma-70 factor (ECF subfamily)